MKKAWDDIKSFITVFQTIYLMIVSFYFGTQAEKLKQYKVEKNQQENIVNDNENGVG